MLKNTPGVYIEELATLPPSVAQVATAIPAFIGYTEKAPAGEVPQVAPVQTLLEFEEIFGKARPTAFTTSANDAVEPLTPAVPETPLWYALSMYFRNGGGRCYVVSVGRHASAGTPPGAASTPPSTASTPPSAASATATSAATSSSASSSSFTPSKDGFLAGLKELELHDEPTLVVMPDAVKLPAKDFGDVCKEALAHCKKKGDRFAILDVQTGGKDEVKAFRDAIGTDDLMYGAAYHPYLQTTLVHSYDEKAVTVVNEDKTTTTLHTLRGTNTARYNKIKTQLAEQRVQLPPSAAVAGVYARVDRERGVWKAPANVSLAAVLGPTKQITFDEQDGLNVDPTSGKSINVIRAFSGKGTLVWGARTLAGNDNEWRYVNVRRLFIMIEESAKKATSFALFEANDASTWLKVKGMLEGYLYSLWEQGALQGATPEAAYYVQVGLGKTMTAQHVLEGKMIVEIGIAAVRPAEFIVLRFSHKLPEA